jgi:hypothetical protein
MLKGKDRDDSQRRDDEVSPTEVDLKLAGNLT